MKPSHTRSKFRRYILSITLLSGLLMGSTLMGPTRAHAEELSVATFIPPQHHINSFYFDWFRRELERLSDGSLTIKLYPAGKLGVGPEEQYSRVVEGVADITFGVQTYSPDLFPKTLLIVPPGKSTNALEATERLLNVYDQHLADEYEDVKLIGLFTVAGDAWASTRDLSTLEGLKGAKIAPFEPMVNPLLEALGAVPVETPVTQMFTGLSTGALDGTTISPAQMDKPWNLAEVSTHYTENIPVTFAVFFIAMNKERYNGLSGLHREIIDALASKNGSMMGAISFHDEGLRGKDWQATNPAEMDKVITISVPDDERTKMDALIQDGMKQIFADYAERGIDNAEEIYNDINR